MLIFNAEYNGILDWLESQLHKDLTINHIHENLRNNLICIKKIGVYNKEKALEAYSKQFKGSCIKCGKYGHKSVDYPDDGESKDTTKRTTGLQGKCWYCGVAGHIIGTCKKLREKMLAK